VIKIKMNFQANVEKLAVKLAEELAPTSIIPLIRVCEIVLDDTSSETSLSIEEALGYVRKSLESIGLRYRRIYVKNDCIFINDCESGDERVEIPLLFCPFCGFSTPYEEVYWIHVKSHGAL